MLQLESGCPLNPLMLVAGAFPLVASGTGVAHRDQRRCARPINAIPSALEVEVVADASGDGIGKATGEGFLANPIWTNEYIGAGPFKLERWDPGISLQGTAFDKHILGRPHFDRLNSQERVHHAFVFHLERNLNDQASRCCDVQ